jgi:ABC-type proline/glycine betaine transport system permease subunit
VEHGIAGRAIDVMAAFLAQWMAPRWARPLAVIFGFAAIGIVGLWTGTVLVRLVDQALLLDVAVGVLYLVSGVAAYQLVRKRRT